MVAAMRDPVSGNRGALTDPECSGFMGSAAYIAHGVTLFLSTVRSIHRPDHWRLA
jgi:hypothetical protein